MEVWFVERIDRDDDREVIGAAVSEEAAGRLAEEDLANWHTLVDPYGFKIKYRYTSYPVEVYE